MTPNICTLIGFPLLDGRFIASMTTIAGAVRQSREEVDPMLRLLARDDIIAFSTKSMARSDSKTREMEKKLIDRVSRNVSILHGRFSECAPKKVATDEKNKKEP